MDKKLWVVPIEPLEERYSAQWSRWWKEELDRCCVLYEFIEPEPLTTKIDDGEFLDVIGTNYYKAMQMAQLMRLLKQGEINTGDVILFHDIWFPGLESLFYVRDALDVDFDIAGYVHAGTHDDYDFLSRCGMREWGRNFEEGWFTEVDYLLVNSHFHLNLIRQMSLGDNPFYNAFVVGYPFHPNDYRQGQRSFDNRENIIVFPHRLAHEKNPQLFDRLAQVLAESDEFKNYKFLKTKNVCKTKEEYYDLLRRAKYSVSFADQETFGIAMVESVLCGCIPVVPDRLSYSELYLSVFKYDSKRGCASSSDVEACAYRLRSLERYSKHTLRDKRSIQAKVFGNAGLTHIRMVLDILDF